MQLTPFGPSAPKRKRVEEEVSYSWVFSLSKVNVSKVKFVTSQALNNDERGSRSTYNDLVSMISLLEGDMLKTLRHRCACWLKNHLIDVVVMWYVSKCWLIEELN